MQPPLFQNFQNFQSASRATLAFLHQRFGFSLWMVTRTEGNDWIVLQSEKLQRTGWPPGDPIGSFLLG